MLNRQEFGKIRSEMAYFEKKREEEIVKSREIIRLSKLIINSLNRDDLKSAAIDAKRIKEKIRKLSKCNYDMQLNRVALQEYVEAICYYDFILKKRIPTRKELGVDTESYLLGICDLTGELVRRAVNDAIKRNFNEAVLIKNLVAEIYSAFLEFDLRNGEIRKKMDSIKYNLMKLEDLVYKITLK